MKIKSITKEEQETKLAAKLSKRKPQKVKPSFNEWLLHDKLAFKVIYLMGAFSGVLIMVAVLAISFVFDWHITLKVLFGALLVWQSWNAYGIVKKHKFINSSVNGLAYKGKHKSIYYKEEATPQ